MRHEAALRMAEVTTTYLLKRFGIDAVPRQQPIEVPNFGRDDLAALFSELGFKRGAEVGVMEGLYSEVLCGANPGLHLFSVDPWTRRREYTDIRAPQESFDEWEASARQRLSKYDGTILKMKSVDGAATIADRSLDFVYLDGDHAFASVVADLHAWTPKVRVGGIMAGHDFAKINHPGRRRYQGAPGTRVVPAVMGWAEAYAIRPWFVLGSKAMGNALVRDRSRSWAWVVA